MTDDIDELATGFRKRTLVTARLAARLGRKMVGRQIFGGGRDADTQREVDRIRALARVGQVVDYIFFVVYGLIALETVLEATGAREGNWFKQFVDAVTMPILAPFRTLFPSVGDGQYRIMFSYIAALLISGLFHLACRGLIRLIGKRTTEI